MRNVALILSFVFCAFSLEALSQNTNQETLKFSLFYPEDSVGTIVLETLDNFERYGHFGEIEIQQKNTTFINEYIKLFEPMASVPDDISAETIAKQPVTIEAYGLLARKVGYRPYVLFIEKTDTTVAVKDPNSDYYYAKVRFFKLFSDKAIIGDSCAHGAVYTVSLKIKDGEREVKITDVELAENEEYFTFFLGNYGRHIYSPILVSNNVNSLAVPIPPPYVPEPSPTKSNIYIHAGYQLTNYLHPEAMRNNLNAAYAFSGEEYGVDVGIKYQKTFGKNSRFGFIVGIEFEENKYNFAHSNASFIYTEDKNGNGLVDLEGGAYDRKYVELAEYTENGTLSYIKPEVGMLVNFGQKALNLQIMGSVGNAFLQSSTYEAEATASFQGEIDGKGDLVSEDALGFYTDLTTTFDGDHSQTQSYMFYKFGAGLDIMMGKHFGISILAEYRNAFTYAIRQNSADLMFLSPDAGYQSQLNMLSNSRTYNALAVQFGFKFFFNEKR